MSEKQSYLQVVNASAGSGKTYSLVKTYIQLLLLDEGENADIKYAEILAMTFTNKAALEMKTRIVKALDELAYPEIHRSDYIDRIAEETKLKKELIREKSRRFLSGILHRYEDFHVLTIDKFNLRLIRSFSRDLNLPPDFEVVLNETPIIEQVVDGILEEIGKNKQLSDILLRYANANIEDEKSWNLRKSLIDFGKVLSSERDLPYVEHLMSLDFSIEDYNKHRAELKNLNETYQKKLKESGEFFNQSGLTKEDFSRGGDIINAVSKCLSGNLNPIDKFPFSETMLGNIEKAAGNSNTAAGFHSLITKLADWFEINNAYAGVLVIYLKNYFNMALLKYMNQALLALNKQERLIRISEFNTKIAELLQEDTVYIYEKLGTRFRHFMLDEFQDTSRLQWMNLIPLIRESLGNGQENFIVGDPKQAIYRFKNGVAEQFVQLPGVYNPEMDETIAEVSSYFEKMGEVKDLKENWRSAPDIVAFNNELFEALRNKLNSNGQAFYSSVKQNPKSDKKGYIYIESKPENKEEDTNEANLRFVLSSVEDALSDGFKPGDICILGRKNRFCTFIATSLTNKGYSVVSADSLNIDSELTVRFVISYFKLRLNPVNQNIIRQFAYLYCELFNHPLNYYNSLFKTVEINDNKAIRIADIELFFEKNTHYKEYFFEPFETLYDLIQKTIRLFGLHELKNPYLHHLADLVHLFETKHGPDLNLFLQDYETMSNDSKAVQIPESDDALKVMTIHKSKGLEFPVVIVPNDMEIKVKGEFFIQSHDYLLRNQLSKSSAIREIREANDDELSKVYLDTLNLYYVAYTRPVSRLYIKNDYEKTGLSTEMHQILKQMPGAVENGDEIHFERGEKLQQAQTETAKEQSGTFFTPESSTDNLWFPDIALQDAEELTSEDYLSEEQRYGNQFHLAISAINYKAEIDPVIRQLIQSGRIEQVFENQLKLDLEQLFTTNAYNELFEDALEVLSEQSYIISKNEQIRPDKIILKRNQTVVLDYKTGQPLKKHNKQLQQYRSVLQEMDYPNVEAHLFYIKNFELVKVEN